jgi:hypothetical protein
LVGPRLVLAVTELFVDGQTGATCSSSVTQELTGQTDRIERSEQIELAGTLDSDQCLERAVSAAGRV